MRRIILGTALILAIVFAAPAFANGNCPTVRVYQPNGTYVQKVVSGGCSHGGTLPFTGLDLGLLVAAGLVLAGVGFSLRRVTRKS
jgi:hypothetical protein